MKTHASFHSLTLAHAFEQFLEDSSFARRTRESYTEDLAPLLAEVGQQPVRALTTDVLQAFLARQESLAPATYNRRLAAVRSFTRWLREQGRNGNRKENGWLALWMRRKSSRSGEKSKTRVIARASGSSMMEACARLMTTPKWTSNVLADRVLYLAAVRSIRLKASAFGAYYHRLIAHGDESL